VPALLAARRAASHQGSATRIGDTCGRLFNACTPTVGAADDPAAGIRYVTRMKLSLDVPARTHVIRAYAPGELRVGEAVCRSNVILTATRLIEGWRPGAIDDLQAADLDPVLALQPEVILIGTGARQQFPDRAVLAALYAARIGFEVMDTRAACRTFNVLVAEGREVAAALII
jgi:uncharacterized protein